jgi:hypothetical protein
MHTAYRALLSSRVMSAVNDAKAVAAISHRGVRGRIREILVGELFRPLAPADIGVGTGQVISSAGDTSAEQDVVIYDRRVLPPALFQGDMGVFPIESVVATVEVKTTLTAQELKSAHDSATMIQTFPYSHGQCDAATDIPRQHNVQKVIAAVLAYGTDLS